MATKAKPAKGTKLQRGDGAGPEVFTTVSEVLSISGPNETVDTVEATSMDSVAKEYVSTGLVDGGECSIELNAIGSDAQQQGLHADMTGGVLRNFKVLYNDAALDANKTTAAFAAYVTNVQHTAGSPTDIYKSSVTLKINGPVSWTYAAA